MPDYRTMFDAKYVGAWDLEKDATVRITRVEAQKLKSARGDDKKPVVYFEKTDKGLVVNKTNGKAIAGMYGPKTEDWVGKYITLYKSRTNAAGGEEVDCVRVRPTVPKQAAAKSEAAPLPPPQREPGDDHV